MGDSVEARFRICGWATLSRPGSGLFWHTVWVADAANQTMDNALAALHTARCCLRPVAGCLWRGTLRCPGPRLAAERHASLPRPAAGC
eukprot:359428-Chlamydomonas_euryale.AAC.2